MSVGNLLARRRAFAYDQRLLWRIRGLSSTPTELVTYRGQRYQEILSFHGDVAAVRCAEGQAFHINREGLPIYQERYDRTFGFYAKQLAAVKDHEAKWFHIDMGGKAVYRERYEWCGNFSPVPNGAQAPVRSVGNEYFCIDHLGQVLSGPYRYVGDANSSGQAVAWDLESGGCMIVNSDGSRWCTGDQSGWIDAQAPHKGIAAVRDKDGWFFVDQTGSQVGCGRYALVEPHYNGQARVQLLSGTWAVIDETGRVLVDLGEADLSAEVALDAMSKKYWESFALKAVLEAEAQGEAQKDPLNTILRNAGVELGLWRKGHGAEDVVLPRGKLLQQATPVAAKCRFWLQDRFVQKWVSDVGDASRLFRGPKLDHFQDISSDEGEVELSHQVLKSYAENDWQGISERLPFHQSKSDAQVVVDLGGGDGTLLREVAASRHGAASGPSQARFICFERPEVVREATASSVSTENGMDIEYQAGDFFRDELPRADTYLMSRVLHDWDDQRAVALLRHVHQQSGESAVLHVVDREVSENNLHGLLSLHMFKLQRSYERSAEQWNRLFESSGWRPVHRGEHNDHVIYSLEKSPSPWQAEVRSDVHGKRPSSEEALVRKAVIPVAGLATRMAPLSILVPKMFMPIPVPDADGCSRMDFAVTSLLSQVLDNVDEAILVASPAQKDILEKYFRQAAPEAIAQSLHDGRVKVAWQRHASGSGHAVYEARDYIGDDPFLVALGDHVFSKGCVQQLLEAYRLALKAVCTAGKQQVRHEVPLPALTGATLCGAEEVQSTGLIRCETRPHGGQPRLVTDMKEKPEEGVAAFEVTPGKFLSHIGLDIFPSDFMKVLEAEVALMERGQQQELCLRKVMKSKLMESGLLQACLLEGQRLDMGNPDAWLSSINHLSQNPSFLTSPPQSAGSTSTSRPGEGSRDDTLRTVKHVLQAMKSPLPPAVSEILSLPEDSVHVASSPGRMDLMGGFADYSGSRALQVLTQNRTVALVSAVEAAGSDSGLMLATIQVPSLRDFDASDALDVQSMELEMGDIMAAEDGRPVPDGQLRSLLLEPQASGGVASPALWPLYMLGTLRAVLEMSPDTRALRNQRIALLAVSDLPRNTGLASSAAIEVATAIAAMNALVPETARSVSAEGLALLCQGVESKVVGANTGPMDQLAVLHGFPRHAGDRRTDEMGSFSAIAINCKMSPDQPVSQTIRLPDWMSVVAVESGERRSVAGAPYELVRRASLIGRSMINSQLRVQGTPEIRHLADLHPSDFKVHQEKLPTSICASKILQSSVLDEEEDGDLIAMLLRQPDEARLPVRAATAHPVEENFRVGLFESLLRCSEAEVRAHQLGEVMAQAHRSYSGCGLGTDAIDVLVDELRQQAGVVGAKVSGGGCGGAVVAVVNKHAMKSQDASGWFRAVKERYFARTGLSASLRTSGTTPARYHGRLSQRCLSTTPASFAIPGGEARCNEDGVAAPRVLMVNHGFPPDFNGGSEVYAQTLSLELLRSQQCADVHVFAREHDPYRSDFCVRETRDALNSDLKVSLMNYAREAPYYRFLADAIDDAFGGVVDRVKPDIVHFHHLNHLSLGLAAAAKRRGAKVVYTIHDYWLMCPRGQFIVTGITPSPSGEPWSLCDGQDDRKCAQRCFAGRYGTLNSTAGADPFDEEAYWTSWISRRMQEVHQMCSHVDVFIAPSKHLYQKYVDEFQIPEEKILYEPYGFDRERFSGRRRSLPKVTSDDPYMFAYIGRHQPAKGINLLVDAALQLAWDTSEPPRSGRGDAADVPPFRVAIFGRQNDNSTRALRRKIDEHPSPHAKKLFEWRSEYDNVDVVTTVFDHVDCIVVPSIWEENSPLVIQEALQCGVPSITADFGGMGELVRDSVNGLTFKHRDAQSLADTMRRAMEHPKETALLSQRGDLRSEDGQIPCIREHTQKILDLYRELSNESHEVVAEEEAPEPLKKMAAPWRVTFDTNPDDCNFKCIMCEQHSPYSPHQVERKRCGQKSRRMDFAQIEKVVKELVPHGLQEIIPTTMGEPLMYKDFNKMMKLCETEGIKLNLTTNGSFLRGTSGERWARQIVPVTSDVKISWNGITEETQSKIMKGSNLEKQKESLHQLIRIRNEVAQEGGNYCSVTLQLTFMEVNLAEIPDLVRFAIEAGCDRVKGHHLWAHFDEIADQNLRRNADSIRRWNSVAQECRKIADENPLPNGRKLRLDNFFDLDPTAALEGAPSSAIHPQATCPFLGQEAWINHSGRFDPCCAPDEERKALGDFGNVSDSSFLDLWNSKAYDRLLKDYWKRPLCKSCNMRRPPN